MTAGCIQHNVAKCEQPECRTTDLEEQIARTIIRAWWRCRRQRLVEELRDSALHYLDFECLERRGKGHTVPDAKTARAEIEAIMDRILEVER